MGEPERGALHDQNVRFRAGGDAIQAVIAVTVADRGGGEEVHVGEALPLAGVAGLAFFRVADDPGDAEFRE
jgi:hypothetical protein